MKGISQEKEMQILEEYKNGTKTRDIAEKVGCARTTITAVISRNGLAFREPAKSKKRVGAKTCPKCRKLVNVQGAKFCPFCGADIRTENELLAEKVLGLGKLHVFLPEAERDNFLQTISKAATELRKIK